MGDGSADGTSGAYYWCLKHNQVERESGCAAKYRIGPFGSAVEAEAGLATMHERERRKQEEDAEWQQ